MAWEFTVLDTIQTWHTPILDVFFKTITYFGGTKGIFVLIGILLLFFKKTRVCGICILSSMAIGAIITNLTLKPLVARDRPCWINDTVTLLINRPEDYSFPSGHSQSSFAASTAIFLNNKRWGIASYVVAALIAFSRLYLYVHFPTDVLVGILLGLIIGYVVTTLVRTKIFHLSRQ